MDLVRRTMVWTAGTALIAAALINLLAVIGRHVGLPFKGSIELVQAAILIAGALSLVAATAARAHARVRLLLDRLSRSARDPAERACTVLAILFYTALLAGSLWLAVDLWPAQEVSEIIGVPWRVMRLFLNLALVAIIVILVRQLFWRRR